MTGRRERADAVRTIPLPDVAGRLGYMKDPADTARWKRPGSVISIDGPKFCDHVRGRGGGGAIDLVIHAEGCGFLQALRRLEGLASPGPCAGDGSPPRPGQPFRGMARGSRKSAGGFWIARRTDPETALLVEGAIDALSAWTLDEGARIDIVISTAGVTGRMPEWIDGFRLGTVLCGYDADDAGDRAAGMLEARHPSIRRMRPDGGKDWNEILQGRSRTRS